MKDDRKLLSIVQVVDSLSAGGAERVAVDLANELSRLGHHSFVCATRSTGSFQSALLEKVSFVNIGRQSTFDMKGIFRFRRFIKQNSIDLAHAHGNSSALFCMVALMGMHVAVVHHDHNSIFQNRKLLIERLLLKRVDAWICVSQPIVLWAKDKVKYQDAFLINNPVDLSRFNNRSMAEKVNAGVNTLALVANYNPYKAHLNLLTALMMIRKPFENYQVKCYGGNTASAYYNEVTSSKEKKGLHNVMLLGSTNEVPKVLDDSIIGLLPSETEGLPISLLEYMAAGLPVVVTDVGESGTIVREAKNGLVVPSKDAEALANAIRFLLENKQEWSAMSTNGLRFVEQNFSLSTFTKRILHTYQSILIA
jgi:glycosyltransferase involved in cell wall biosynthesis